MFSIPFALAMLASLGLLVADVPLNPVDEAGTQVAKSRKARPAKRSKDRPAKAPAPDKALPVNPSGRTRVIMENLRITGQTTNPGELRVLNRKSAELASLVRLRRAYRAEIIQTVFPLKGTRE